MSAASKTSHGRRHDRLGYDGRLSGGTGGPAVKDTVVLCLLDAYGHHHAALSRMALELRRQLEGVSSVKVGTTCPGGEDLLDQLRGHRRAILIDIIREPADWPAAVYRLAPEQLPIDEGLWVVDCMDLSSNLEFGRRLGWTMPEEIVIFAVELLKHNRFSELHNQVFSATLELAAAQIVDEALKPGGSAARGEGTHAGRS
jgi:Ni,Fe-hydrogenase maturation factor